MWTCKKFKLIIANQRIHLGKLHCYQTCPFAGLPHPEDVCPGHPEFLVMATLLTQLCHPSL